jgi:hypothetical protein
LSLIAQSRSLPISISSAVYFLPAKIKFPLSNAIDSL